MELLTAQEALFYVIKQSSQIIKETPADTWTMGRVGSYLDLLESYWTDFEHNHRGLIPHSDIQDTPYFNHNHYSKAEVVLTETRGILYDIRNRLQPIRPPMQDPPQVNPSTSKGAARLPRIVIRRFSGRREEWESFRDIFRSLIRDDSTLSNVDKMYYLKSHTHGEAKLALDSFQVTSANYPVAWSTLESRYDHRRLFVQDHLTALKNPRPLREESSTGLQSLLEALEHHRDQLRVLEEPIDKWDSWFLFFAANGMDPITRRDWEEELENLELASDSNSFRPTFAMLTSFLQHRCRTLKSVEPQRSAHQYRTTSRESSVPVPISHSLRIAATSTPPSGKCAACRHPHYIGRCDLFKGFSTRQRRELVARERLCFNCLREDHNARDCPSNVSCRVCDNQHHTLIHEGAGKRLAPNMQDEIPAKVPRPADQETGASASHQDADTSS